MRNIDTQLKDITELKDIGRRIQEQRKKLKMNQETLAKAIGCKREMISYYEQGSRDIKTETLAHLSKALNVSTDYLLGLSDVLSTDTELKGVCEYTGLSQQVVSMFNGELKTLDKKKELSVFLGSKYGKAFLKTIIDFRNSVDEYVSFRGELAASSDESFILQGQNQSEDKQLLLDILGVSDIEQVAKYEIVGYRMTKIIQKYFDERAEKLITPVMDYEFRKNAELLQSEQEINELLDGVNNGGDK